MRYRGQLRDVRRGGETRRVEGWFKRAREGEEGRETRSRGGQAINTTRRHARRLATAKVRFIRARSQGRKGWFLAWKPSHCRLIGFQLSKCRRLKASSPCPSPVPDAFPPFRRKCAVIYSRNVRIVYSARNTTIVPRGRGGEEMRPMENRWRFEIEPRIELSRLNSRK